MPTLSDYAKLVRHKVGRLLAAKPVLPKVGDKAPEFTCKAHDGSTVRLADFRGRKVLLWFYPKADTPGCTIEGRGFCDRNPDFTKKNVQILGCSFDTAAENKAFADKFGYQYPLLCDTDRSVGLAYGACTSRQAKFADRISFLIDEKGNIAAAFPKVTPASHPTEILAQLG